MPEEQEPKLTEEELKHAAEFLKLLAEGRLCPRCKQPIESRKQVGRSIYLKPCGHRLGTGRLPKSPKKKSS